MKKKRRCGLFLERLWRVGELNTADTCQGFWGCNRGTFRKKGCLANEHRRIRMAGRERMHTKRFLEKLGNQPRDTFPCFSPCTRERASERAPACDAVANPGNGALLLLRPSSSSGEDIATSEQARSREATSLDGCRAPCHGRLPSIVNSPGRHLGPHANLCDRRRFPAHLQWCSEHTLPPPVFSRTTLLTSSVSWTGKFSNDKSEALSLSTPGQRHSQSVSRISVDSKKKQRLGSVPLPVSFS